MIVSQFEKIATGIRGSASKKIVGATLPGLSYLSIRYSHPVVSFNRRPPTTNEASTRGSLHDDATEVPEDVEPQLRPKIIRIDPVVNNVAPTKSIERNLRMNLSRLLSNISSWFRSPFLFLVEGRGPTIFYEGEGK